MSVVINTNYAATVAANNLAASNELLQKSLNRLSSGSKIVTPSDDAGGLAVAMKLSAAATRQGAVANNLANSVSYLQTQDGVLNTTGKVLSRISELKTLYADPTKNASDLANYQKEFAELQAQLKANANETFNGISLFGTNNLTVAATEDASTASAIKINGVNLLSSVLVSDNFSNLSNWTTLLGAPSASNNTLHLPSPGGNIRLQNNQLVSGPFTINFDIRYLGANKGNFFVDFSSFNTAMDTPPVIDTNTHHISMTFDGAGNFASYLDGSTTAFDTHTPGNMSGNLQFGLQGLSDGVDVQNFAVTSGAGNSLANVTTVAGASDLGSLSLSGITGAIQDVAGYRAQNGADQSRLGFSAELLTVNKANMEQATSRIMDVDVASESTRLARYNILVQAGTSMLSQANQSSQMALKLLS